MLPYLAMLAVPSVFALSARRHAGFVLLAVAVLYWLMVGFRFQVGMDWNNYIRAYRSEYQWPLSKVLVSREPASAFLYWAAGQLGGGIILVNAVSGLVFCWGLFSVAKRCREPLLAIVVATPLLVVGLAMSGIRQAIACGVIFYLFATWERRSTFARFLFVLVAMLFHFSAVFVMIFVALASRSPPIVRAVSAAIVALIVVAIIRFAPQSVEAYSRLYVGPERKSAPGAIVQVGVLAIAGATYLLTRGKWARVTGENLLYGNLAWASLLSLPMILVSSIGTYRFALYFWPMGMYVYAGLPSLMNAALGRALYRLIVVSSSFAILIGWLLTANNSLPWLPYRNWLLEPAGESLLRHGPVLRQ